MKTLLHKKVQHGNVHNEKLFTCKECNMEREKSKTWKKCDMKKVNHEKLRYEKNATPKK